MGFTQPFEHNTKSIILYRVCLLYHTLTSIHRIIDKKNETFVDPTCKFPGMYTVCMPFLEYFFPLKIKIKSHKNQFYLMLILFIYMGLNIYKQLNDHTFMERPSIELNLYSVLYIGGVLLIMIRRHLQNGQFLMSGYLF